MWYVLEHVSNPRALLTEVSRILQPNGIILVCVPNLHYLRTKGALLGLVNKAKGMWHLDEHLFHYTAGTLTRMLELTGFEPMVQMVAKPFYLGQGVRDAGKQLVSSGVRMIFRLTGLNLGGILVYARKAKIPESLEIELGPR
jgi:hypothetical protein